MPSAYSELGAEWGWSAVAEDAGRALPHIRGAPLASLFAVLIVIVGVSTNTSIFAVVNATLIRVPPHVTDPDTLVQIGRLKADGDFDNFSYPNYADIRDRNQVFSGVAAYGRASTLARMTSGTFPL